MDWDRWRRVCARTDSMVPLRVEITLRAPLASTDPWVNLDALLAHRAISFGRHPSSRHHPTYPHRPDEIELIPIPVKWDRQLRVWRCSALHPTQPVGPGVTHWTMRPTVEHAYLVRDKLLRTSHGQTRMRREQLTLWPCLTWEAELEGCPRYVPRLLERVHGIGKKTAQGWGAVHTIRVTTLDRPARWLDWDGTLARPVPHPDGQLAGVRPPYWHTPWWEPALMPGDPTPGELAQHAATTAAA